MPTWTPDSWRSPTHKFRLEQQPPWGEEAVHQLDDTLKVLSARPPLIFAGEARTLTSELASAAMGESFVLQAGDCAETFADHSADRVRDSLKLLLQIAAVLTYSAEVPVVKIGRMAGQFAKPRSSDTETSPDGIELPSYRGDMFNDAHFSHHARVLDPRRILAAYDQAAGTLNLVRAFTSGGFADLADVHAWNREFVASSPEGARYESIAAGITKTLRVMKACGLDGNRVEALRRTVVYTSHEALYLPYEEALTRQDSTAENEWYDCSAHMLWIGTRTKKLDSAHVEFLSGVGNPIGCKVDADLSDEDLVSLCDKLNPGRRPGRLSLISRMGKDRVQEGLPRLVKAVERAGHPVVWMCDPMHGNTVTSSGGLKTRRFDDVLQEITEYFAVHHALGTWPGGLHLELTADDVTECVGGGDNLAEADLHDRYNTACDPRLNARQSLDLAFRVAELVHEFSTV